MSTTVIKNGTIVTADLTYKADVMIEGGVITAIGPNLTEDQRKQAGLAAAIGARQAHLVAGVYL